jgi:hypothetical protein
MIPVSDPYDSCVPHTLDAYSRNDNPGQNILIGFRNFVLLFRKYNMKAIFVTK